MTQQNRFPEAVIAAGGTAAILRDSTTYPTAPGEIAYATDTKVLYVARSTNAKDFIPVVNLVPVKVCGGSYTLKYYDHLVVFTATATATLPAATGSGQTFRICNEGSGTVTIQASGAETIKGTNTKSLTTHQDMILTDYATGLWA